MARKPAAEAPNFRRDGLAKMFITKKGTACLLLGFSDGSVLVLRMVRGTKGASADFKPIPIGNQKALLKRLGARKGKRTYDLGWSLLEGK